MNADSISETDEFAQKQTNVVLVETLKLNLDRQLTVCKRLEYLADQLPDRVDATECLSLTKEMIDSLADAHKFEESILFPILEERFCQDSQQNNQLCKTLERLRFEHLEDEGFAEELKTCLEDFSKTGETDNVNLLGYMLRGFFEGVRRHTAFEREHILPMLEVSS